MTRRAPLVVALLPLGLAIAGCGGGGSPAGPPGAGGVFSVAGMEVRTDSGAAASVLTLPSPANSPVAFTAVHGATIIGLREIGYAEIAFVSDRIPNSEIFLMNADGTNQTRLTTNSLKDGHPDWSADGRKLVVERRRGGNWDVWSMNADGSGSRRLTTHTAVDGDPDWSPDGQKIAYRSNEVPGNDDIYVVNSDGTGHVRLTTNATGDCEPDWSPNGKKIAFNTDRAGDNEIYVMNADGSGQANLTNLDTGNDREPAWSPDGRQIAFASDRDARFEIYVMNADGSSQTRLTNHPASDRTPAWSPNGREIAFRSDRDGNWETYLMDADGRNVRNLTNHGANDHAPAWRPAPSVKRCLIGPAGCDAGSDPPFGDARPLALLGVSDGGLVSAATVGLNRRYWGTLQVEALDDLGDRLAGVKITGTQMRSVLEDVGRGLAPRQWDISATPDAGVLLVFFLSATGKIASVLVTSGDTSPAASAAQGTAVPAPDGKIVLRGTFTAALSAADPGRNLIADRASEVTLDSRTGEVVRRGEGRARARQVTGDRDAW